MRWSLLNREAGLEEELAALDAEVTQDVASLFKDPLADVDLVLDHTLPIETHRLAVTGGAGEFTLVNTTATHDSTDAVLFVRQQIEDDFRVGG